MFYPELSVILLAMLHQISANLQPNQDWDLAVVIDDQIDFLSSNGSLIGSTSHQFKKLKALTFDNIRHQLIVSDMDHMNDTIFTVQLTKETEITPIIEDLPDDVQGLAIDPLTDILYWTDTVNRTLNYLNLNDTTRQPRALFTFTDEEPRDVAVDVCRRYIYWTNANIDRPTIERASLDDLQREILIDTDLFRPTGVAIDYNSQRLYWADLREGIYFRIESTNLDGKERETLYQGTHSKPFDLAVDDEAIYWTDVSNNAIWKISKLNYEDERVPERLRNFHERPMGIVANNLGITSLPDCKNIAQALQQYNESALDVFNKLSDEGDFEAATQIDCLNNGELVKDVCKCPLGFTGKLCEIKVCHNFCVHGDCYLSSLGSAQCHCTKGFAGKRCEKDMCDGFCLNEARCTPGSPGSKFPKCSCRDGYVGVRCEASLQVVDVCRMFCLERDSDEVVQEIDQYACRCNKGAFTLTKANNASTALLLTTETSEFSTFAAHFQDPTFLVMSCLLVVMLIAVVTLSVRMCTMRRRPRIKKRFIVNQNVTPLTYRPQPTTEHCEITIENCCNMNVCETPCFEPPQFRGLQTKNDDKRNLLSNMENGEDMY